MTLLQAGLTDGIIGVSYLFFFRLLIDAITAFVLIRYIYFPIYKTRDYMFLFFIFNLLIFIITFLLSSIHLSIGTAFGLFAVFSMLKYRTERMSVKNMTYIFLLIAIGLINGVGKLTWEFICLLSMFILAVAYLLESWWLTEKQTQQTEISINLKHIRLEQQDDLIADIEMKLGVKIIQIVIKKVDFVKQIAIIDICYYNGRQVIIENKDGHFIENDPAILKIADPTSVNNFDLPHAAKNTFMDINGSEFHSLIVQKPKEKFKIKDRDLKFKDEKGFEIIRERKKEKRKLA